MKQRSTFVPCICSSTSSRTRLNNWSYPLSTPVTDSTYYYNKSGGHQPTLVGWIRDMPSRPPVNLTRMRALAYFARSRIASRFGLSSVGWGPCGPPWRPPPPRWEDDPPPPPRCAPRPMPPRPWKSGVARNQVRTISFFHNLAVGGMFWKVCREVAYPVCHAMLMDDVWDFEVICMMWSMRMSDVYVETLWLWLWLGFGFFCIFRVVSCPGREKMK